MSSVVLDKIFEQWPHRADGRLWQEDLAKKDLGHLNIKMASYQYRDYHVKMRRSRLSSTRE